MDNKIRTCLLSALLVAGISSANAAGSKNDIYSDLGVATIDNGTSTSTGLHYKIGYNYYITPFIAIDLSYNETQTLKSPNENPGSNEFSYDYTGWSAGLKAEHYFAQNFSVYAKGGASSLTITEKSYDANQGQFVETEDSGVYPYGTVGVDLLTPNKNFKVNANYSYQMLEGDAASSAFSVGASYQFQ